MSSNVQIAIRTKKGNRLPRSTLEIYYAGYPMERVHLDILGLINPRSKSGSDFILFMVDQFTKWVELAPLPAQNSKLMAGHFSSILFQRLAVHLRYIQNKGAILQSDLFQAFCKVLEITKARTTPYHPSSNGQVEVFNRTILQMIRAYVSRGVMVPLISMALHSTGFSANMLMLGREVIQPIDLMLGIPSHTS